MRSRRGLEVPARHAGRPTLACPAARAAPLHPMVRRSNTRRYAALAWWLSGLGSLASCAARVGGDLDGGELDAEALEGGRRDAARDARFRDVPTAGDDAFVEPPCPDAGTSARLYRCDPFSQRGCGPGEACYPFIEYTMDRCDRERFGAECRPAGAVPVGSACDGSQPCVPGASCFATGAGTRCLRLCRLDGTAPTCPRGAVCEPTDNPDLGACD